MPSTLPSGSPEPVMHPVLARGAPHLSMWDMRTRPLSFLRTRCIDPHPNNLHLTPSWLHEPATSPPLDSVSIRSDVLGDKPMVVFPANERRSFVAVLDVLDAMYREVRRLFLPLSRERSGVSDRCLGAPHAGGDPGRLLLNRAGVCPREPQARSSWVWGGLTPSICEREVWILQVG